LLVDPPHASGLQLYNHTSVGFATILTAEFLWGMIQISTCL